MNEVADANRDVTARVQQAIDEGFRSRQIDANDLVEVLLAIADELDPSAADLVDAASGYSNCGQHRADRLVWDDNEVVHCARCGANYRPGE